MERESNSEGWQSVYQEKTERDLSWHEPRPSHSLDVVLRHAPQTDARIIDVGAGTSRLVDALLDRGYRKVTVLDVAREALKMTADRLGTQAKSVRFVDTNVLEAESLGQFDLWHDRALFHFLIDAGDRTKYVQMASRSLAPNGHLVVSTFAENGPERCSGLPTRRYGIDGLAAEFVGFDLVDSDAFEHVTPWGAAQPFSLAVFRKLSPQLVRDRFPHESPSQEIT